MMSWLEFSRLPERVSILTGEGEQTFSKREGRILASCLLWSPHPIVGDAFISYFSKGAFSDFFFFFILTKGTVFLDF